MKRFTLPIVCLLLLIVGIVYAQQGVPGTLVQLSPTDLQACTTANATAAVGSAATLTLTPPNGWFVYLNGLDLTISQNATGSAHTNLSFTSTNLGGWAWKYSYPVTVNGSLTQSFIFQKPIKSAQPGVAVTIVSPAGQTNSAYSINGYYYFAP